MSIVAHPERLDPGFKNLRPMVVELGDSLVIQRRSLEDLIQSVRESMTPARPRMRAAA